MKPFPSKKRLKALQSACAKALTQARTSCGKERLRSFAAAFPFSVNGSVVGGALRISWNKRERAFNVGDQEGFLTLVDAEELAPLIMMESARKGAARAWMNDETLQPLPVPKFSQPKAKKIRLSDLKLNLGEIK